MDVDWKKLFIDGYNKVNNIIEFWDLDFIFSLRSLTDAFYYETGIKVERSHADYCNPIFASANLPNEQWKRVFIRGDIELRSYFCIPPVQESNGEIWDYEEDYYKLVEEGVIEDELVSVHSNSAYYRALKKFGFMTPSQVKREARINGLEKA